jgi:hypothetical protein
MLHNPHGREVRLAQSEARRAKFAAALREVTERIPEQESQRLLASVTALCSAAGWETIRDNWELSGPAAAAAVQWAVRTLIDASADPSDDGR